MLYASDHFGISGRELAMGDLFDPQTSLHGVYATTDVRDEPPRNPIQALTDPRGSAIFWIAAAAILGLVLITGQVKLEAAIGSR